MKRLEMAVELGLGYKIDVNDLLNGSLNDIILKIANIKKQADKMYISSTGKLLYIDYKIIFDYYKVNCDSDDIDNSIGLYGIRMESDAEYKTRYDRIINENKNKIKIKKKEKAKENKRKLYEKLKKEFES